LHCFKGFDAPPGGVAVEEADIRGPEPGEEKMGEALFEIVSPADLVPELSFQMIFFGRGLGSHGEGQVSTFNKVIH